MAFNISKKVSEKLHNGEESTVKKQIVVPDYTLSCSSILDHVLAFAIGFAAGYVVLFVFYKSIVLGFIGGALTGIINIFMSEQSAKEKRLKKLRTQFFDMLESMSVAMRAGNPMLKALQSARSDLSLIYPEDSDIITEVDIILARFNNGMMLSESFNDFAERCKLEDVKSFASVYSTIEGKSGRADEIIKETQSIIADKMEIEMEIDTLMTAAKSEVTIMLFLPLIILLVIGNAGAGFMDAIYTTSIGHAIATGGLIIFFLSFFLARKFSNVEI